MRHSRDYATEYSFTSSLIGGVGRGAAYVVDRLMGRLSAFPSRGVLPSKA
jgi:hypothetical protein